MARGWESKAVEEQQGAAERDRGATVKRALTPEEMERQRRREGLLLSRAQTLHALQGACNAQYRALLERTLAHLDEELATFES